MLPIHSGIDHIFIGIDPGSGHRKKPQESDPVIR